MNSILDKYSSDKRLYKGKESEFNMWLNHSCIFGMAHINNPFTCISEIPKNIGAVYTFFGEGSYDIIEYMITTGINQNLESLTIGFEHSNMIYGYKDYSKITQLLSSVSFPKLKFFEYGVDYLIVNEEQYYPHLGDITNLLVNMPSLKELNILGTFELSRSVSFKNIRTIYVSSTFAESTNGFISNQTLKFLLKSEFNNLEDFQIALESNDVSEYNFDEQILLNNIDKLRCVAIDGRFEKGTKRKLYDILTKKVDRLFLDGIEEV